ncbi:MAG: purine-binding chemotaxis protein CheW [Actinobacteria bacterium]|nr:MAG: purine-binding chemotaxis protein CheW [Actinomycetota bacterium]
MTVQHTTPAGGRYLTFGLDDQIYGLEILRVQEIVGLLPVTRVPRLPAAFAGVVNLRGRVIPVIDLRQALGMDASAMGERTCIVIARLEGDVGDRVVGLVVDTVSDVVAFTGEQMEATPEFGRMADTSYISAIGRVEGRVVLLLDIDEVLSDEQASAVESAARAACEDGEGSR